MGFAYNFNTQKAEFKTTISSRQPKLLIGHLKNIPK